MAPAAAPGQKISAPTSQLTGPEAARVLLGLKTPQEHRLSGNFPAKNVGSPSMPSSDNHTPPIPFRGFRSPIYTPVPDELFDELLVELSGAELKALLYIVRRTFGFKRDSDNISLSQMLQGIRTRDGRVLDRGVGLSKKTLLLALRSLEDRGIILTERR